MVAEQEIDGGVPCGSHVGHGLSDCWAAGDVPGEDDPVCVSSMQAFDEPQTGVVAELVQMNVGAPEEMHPRIVSELSPDRLLGRCFVVGLNPGLGMVVAFVGDLGMIIYKAAPFVGLTVQ